MRHAWLAPLLGLACAPHPEPIPPARFDASLPRFHCAFDARCPELAIEGAGPARLGGKPSPFRGNGDPSLEHDPESGSLWLAWSWLDQAGADFAIRTRLAKSDDRGRT